MKLANLSTDTGPKVTRELVSKRLRELAYRSGPGAKLPTTRELRDTIGTSLRTIDDALGVLEAQNVICRKQGSGIFVSPKLHQKNVRIFFNSNLISRAGISPFWGILSGLILSEVQRRAADDQSAYAFELIPAVAFRDAALTDELTKHYREGLIHGMLAVGMGEQAVQREFDADVPVVSYADTGHWQVGTTWEDAARLGVDAVAALGCKRLGIWTYLEGDGDILDGNPMMDGLERILRPYQIPLIPEYIQRPRTYLSSRPDFLDLTYQEQGYLTALLVFSQPGPKPDGLFLGDDMFAAGVLTAFHELGIRPGVDVHVVTTCNAGSPTLFGYESMMTLVEYDPAELVTAMFNVLDTLMAREVPDREMMLVKPRLIKPGERVRRDEIKGRYGLLAK